MNETPIPIPEQDDGAAQPDPAQPGQAGSGPAQSGPYQQSYQAPYQQPQDPYQRQAGQYPPGGGYQQPHGGYQQPHGGYQQPGAGAPHARTSPLHSFFASVRRTGLFRSEERWVGGVAGGLARRLDLDPVLVRCVWVVLMVFSGLGLVLYGLAWALLPEERDGRIHAEQASCGDINAGLAGAAVAVITGFGLGEGGLFPAWFVLGWTSSSVGRVLTTLFWVGLILLVLWAVTRGSRMRKTPQPEGTYPGGPHTDGTQQPGGMYPGGPHTGGTQQPGGPVQPTTAWAAAPATEAGRPPHTPQAPLASPSTVTSVAPVAPAGTAASADAAAAPRAATVTADSAVGDTMSATDADDAAGTPDPADTEGPAGTEGPASVADPMGTADTVAPVAPAANPPATADAAYAAQPAPSASTAAFHTPYQPTPGPTPAWASTPVSSPGAPTGPRAGGPAVAPAWRAPAAPVPVPVAPPRVPGPGRSLSLTVLALILFSLAASGLTTTTGRLGVLSALVVCAGLLVTTLGLGVVISAFRGRRGGWMSVWGFLTLIIAVPSLFFGSLIGGVGALNGRIPNQEVNIVVTEAMLDGAGGHLDLGDYAVGTVNIDLRDLPAEATRGVTIGVSVGVGSVRVWTQQGQAVTVNAEIGIGEMSGTLAETWHSSGVTQSQRTYAPWAETYSVTGKNVLDTYVVRNGLDLDARLASPAAQTDGTTDALQIDVEVGVGVVRVDERRNEVTWAGWVYDAYWVVDSWQEPNGMIHDGTEPVPGMTFPAVSSDDVRACTEKIADRVAPDDAYDWPDGPDSLDLLPDDVRAEVDACVLERIGIRTGQVPPDAEPVPSPTAVEPTALATDAATPAPTATP
ncbi:PspC domain-containing protein [Actinomyces respiraculi]|uniref:PspC domain-containing protein n=1 Tax=Actinomyces respiraculi TaxID=2744574 RepID=UPI00141DAFF2|nr:PspC domain-containing protein [Actinomyces respiraculi]